MRKYVLDTNIYVNAFRSRHAAGAVEEFLATFAPSIYLNSVVLLELLVGANTRAKARQVEDTIAAPLVRVGRVITPSRVAWAAAGLAISTMCRREKRDVKSLPKSLVNDYLLAASCRESGVTVITENTADFEQIQRYIPVSFEAPWPA